LRRALLLTMIVLAGCGPSPSRKPEAPTKAVASITTETPEQLLREEEIQNEACRGGSGDDPKTDAACTKRDALVKKLRDAGMCYGPPELPMYQQKWGPCPEPKKSALATLASASQPQEEQVGPEASGEPDSDTVHFDPREANLRIQMSSLETSIYGCMSKATELYLRQGVKSRKELRSLAMFRCTFNARPFMSSKGIPKDEQDRFLEGLAEEATTNTIAELGGR